MRWLRLRAQGLADTAPEPDAPEPHTTPTPTPTITAAVRKAAALQAQAPTPLRLQVWSRTHPTHTHTTHALHAPDVDTAIAKAAVIRTWLMRGTLHLVAADDLRAFLTVLGPVNLRADRRRREQLGLTDHLCARAMDALPAILAGGRALTRAEIVAGLADHGVVIDLKTQQPPHLLAFAANSALICRGPDAARDEPTYVLLDDWLASASEPCSKSTPTLAAAAGPAPAARPTPTREAALTRLAERYFAAYAPATTADLAAWSGLPAADAKAAVALIRDSLEEVDHDGQRLLIPRDTAPTAPTEPTPPQNPYRLLPRFDPYLLGHRSRDLILAPAFANRVNAGGGMIAQTMLADGRIVGTWKPNQLEPFEAFPPAAAEAWHREMASAAAF